MIKNDDIYDILTSQIEVNDNDTKCSPSRKFEYGSCIRLEILVKCAEAYNEEYPNDAIQLDTKMETLHPHKYKKYLVKEFNEKLRDECDTQKCWLKQSFIKKIPKIAQIELEKYTWRPESDNAHKDAWLDSNDINNIMAQYEMKYPDFKFLGAVPRDFQNLDIYRMDENLYKKLWQSGKNKVGIVYNTDPSHSSGTHWNGLFCNFNTGEIYFFDSFSTAPNKEVREHMKQLERFIRKNCNEMTKIHRNKNNLMKCNNIKMDYNKVRAQYGPGACGLYSTNFIIRMLRGDAFENICNEKVTDKQMEQCRKVYLRESG